MWGAVSAISIFFPYISSLLRILPPPPQFEDFAATVGVIVDVFVFILAYIVANSDETPPDDTLTMAVGLFVGCGIPGILLYVLYLILPKYLDISALPALVSLVINLFFFAVHLLIFGSLTFSFTALAAVLFQRHEEEGSSASSSVFNQVVAFFRRRSGPHKRQDSWAARDDPWLQIAEKVQQYLESKYCCPGGRFQRVELRSFQETTAPDTRQLMFYLYEEGYSPTSCVILVDSSARIRAIHM
jgi:hypothetical protein